jgi:hypothetical protein
MKNGFENMIASLAMKPGGVKEQIVEIIRGQGYDFISACEIATDTIIEFNQSNKKEETYGVGKACFTLRKK